MLVCLAGDARTTRTVRDSGCTICVLAGDQAAVARRSALPGGSRSPDDDVVVGTDAVAVTAAVEALRCRVVRTVEVGDHTAVFGQVTAAQVREGPPLVHREGTSVVSLWSASSRAQR